MVNDPIKKRKTSREVNKFCPKCGAKVGPEDRFCPECGEKLDVVVQKDNFTILQIITIIASALVIVSFFLPWGGSKTGPQLVGLTAKMFEFSDFSSEWILLGIGGLLFLLSPIVCHLIFLIVLLSRKYVLKALPGIPIAIWVILFAWITIEAEELMVPSGKVVSPGVIGTLLGMVISLIVVNMKVPEVQSEAKSGRKICSYCSTENEPESEFCENCGKKLT